MTLTQFLKKYYRHEFANGGLDTLTTADAKQKANELFKRGELSQGVWGELCEGEDVPERKIVAMRKQMLSSHPTAIASKPSHSIARRLKETRPLL